MRKRSLDMVHALAKRDERVVFIGSDLSPNLLGEMKKEFPQRYYMEGIAEANIIGMAAGMAMDGFVPYVNTIATFITRRCYEQVAVDLCLHDLPVRLIGNGGGYVYAPLGPTHEAIEDIAIMRALPRMTVTAVCDAEEMTRLMDATLDWPHPIYIRLGKGGDPVISKPERRIDVAAAIADQPHRQIMQAKIDRDLLVAAARDEGRDRVDVGQKAFHREAGRHADHVRLGDALHEPALGHLPAHAVEQAGAEVRADEDHALVAPRQLVHHVEAGLAHRYTSAALSFAITSGPIFAL